jgi:hypothetical protein
MSTWIQDIENYFGDATSPVSDVANNTNNATNTPILSQAQIKQLTDLYAKAQKNIAVLIPLSGELQHFWFDANPNDPQPTVIDFSKYYSLSDSNTDNLLQNNTFYDYNKVADAAGGKKLESDGHVHDEKQNKEYFDIQVHAYQVALANLIDQLNKISDIEAGFNTTKSTYNNYASIIPHHSKINLVSGVMIFFVILLFILIIIHILK